MNKTISNYLFETEAIQVCPDGEPFFYTSGKLGPYYINTHYLYGSKEYAENFLKGIEAWKEDLHSYPSRMFQAAKRQYDQNPIYKEVIDQITDQARKLDFDYISGGERRDYFFSLLPAAFLGKPHLSILKDGTVIYSDSSFNKSRVMEPLEWSNKNVLHIADLVTEASSYIRCWIPAIQRVGGQIHQTLSVVNRNQGGDRILSEQEIELISLVRIDQELFIKAKKQQYITDNQYQMIMDFSKDPDRFMKSFLKSHPGFLSTKLALGGKSAQRAQLCIDHHYDRD